MCSLHFHGGMKSFSALPTVVKISCRQTANSSQGKIQVIKTTTETSQSEQQTTAIDAQESAIEKLKTEHAVLQRKYDELSSKYKQCVLQIEQVHSRHNF